ncbi:MAG TPA: hypothetical protein VFV87_09050 [Pirellulaceae bacterium]|nr:hypothetical protein [Pirellulaceae bacterium]
MALLGGGTNWSSVFGNERAAHPGSGCCAECGCQCSCRKVCQLIYEKKQVPKISYRCECEDFCVPGPSQRCKVPCDCCDGCCKHKDHIVYTPTCAEVRTRHKVVRIEETEEVCKPKWVVRYLCEQCAQSCPQAERAPGPAAAQAPAVTDLFSTLFSRSTD